MSDVIVLIGAGSIGQAIVRRVSAGKIILLADIRQENAEAAAKILRDASFTSFMDDWRYGSSLPLRRTGPKMTI